MDRKRIITFFCTVCLPLCLLLVPLTGATVFAAGKSMNLKFYTHEPAPPPKVEDQAGTARGYKWLAEQIEKRTDGRIKVKIFWGGTLGPPKDSLKMIGSPGIADMGNMATWSYRWDVPISGGGPQLPFLTRGLREAPRAMGKLYGEWPYLEQEWKKWNVKILCFAISGTYHLAVDYKGAINKLDDLSGLKVRGVFHYPHVLKEFGIVNVSMGSRGIYEAIQRGVIDGAIMPFAPIKVFKWDEVINQIVDFTFAGGQNPVPIGINLDVWNKISPADQEIIQKIGSEASDYFADAVESGENRAAQYFKAKNIKIVHFSPEEEARIKRLGAEKAWNIWVEQCKKRGAPGDEFLKRYLPIVEKVKEGLPK